MEREVKTTDEVAWRRWPWSDPPCGKIAQYHGAVPHLAGGRLPRYCIKANGVEEYRGWWLLNRVAAVRTYRVHYQFRMVVDRGFVTAYRNVIAGHSLELARLTTLVARYWHGIDALRRVVDWLAERGEECYVHVTPDGFEADAGARTLLFDREGRLTGARGRLTLDLVL
ncbi:MAG: hypothetical protein LM577_08165 [Thermoproteaceae archaeon]|nr:hypothetical protein [Thermoproteaceae archaeon]